jgi:group II intron reverse transcriptase/maturase
MNKGNQRESTRQKPAEFVEQRGGAEGNARSSLTDGTQGPSKVSRGLMGVREAAKRDKELQFTALVHHISEDLLLEAFGQLKRSAAPGVDGLRWAAYEAGHEGRIRDLHERIHTGRYRALPVRRARIPKEDGSQRLLGIAALEDKIVQHATVTVLNAIYEEDFLGFSYGFRPERGPHMALDALWVGIVETPVNWVLDLDIRGYFDHIQHEALRRFLGHRLADKRMLRLVDKWLRAGVLDEGNWLESKMGSPQGGVVSPALSNLYLHEVLDVWFEYDVKPRLRGRAFAIRFADDAALVFEREEDARRVLVVLWKRFAKYGLRLHPEKTRLVDFRSPPRAGPKGSQGERSFVLLGFTHFWGRSRKGRWVVQRKTAKDRFTRALREIGCWCRAHRHWPVAAQQAALRRKLQGHYAYYGITGNARALARFLYEVRRLWRKWLCRRSWHGRMPWEVRLESA